MKTNETFCRWEWHQVEDRLSFSANVLVVIIEPIGSNKSATCSAFFFFTQNTSTSIQKKIFTAFTDWQDELFDTYETHFDLGKRKPPIGFLVVDLFSLIKFVTLNFSRKIKIKRIFRWTITIDYSWEFFDWLDDKNFFLYLTIRESGHYFSSLRLFCMIKHHRLFTFFT